MKKIKPYIITLIIISLIMITIIGASKIYEIVNHDIINDNIYDNVEFDENVESSPSSFMTLNFNFKDVYTGENANQEGLNKAAETFSKQNNNVYDVEAHLEITDFFPDTTEYGVFLYYSYDFSYGNDYPIQYLSVKVKEVYTPDGGTSNNADEDYWYQIFNPNESGAIKFNIVQSKEEFDDMDQGNEGKIGLLSKGNNQFTLFFKTLAYVEPNPESQYAGRTWAMYQFIVDFIDRQLNSQLVSITSGKNIYKIDNNELINENDAIKDSFNLIIDNWSKGKETATLKCSIGEYYDESGNLVISTKNNDLPMMFNIRDLVIPYIPTARGGTEPMSIKLDGTPKVFQVTQVRPYFDGACWQEIMLQEYTGDNPSANKA